MSCPKCGCELEPGFLLDRANSPSSDACIWVGGSPDRSLFTGVKTTGRRILPVLANRCTSCGHLELSAPSEGTEVLRCLRCGAEMAADQSTCSSCGWAYDGVD